MRVESSKIPIFASFARFISERSHIQGHNYYIVICRLAFQWHRNRLPWMTLNGHFALKSVLRSARHGFACSGFRAILFWNLQSYAYTASSKNVAERLYSFWWCKIYGLFTWVRWRGSVKQQNCVHSSLICCSMRSIIYKEYINHYCYLKVRHILYGQTRFMSELRKYTKDDGYGIGMDSKRTTTKCIATALVCQPCWVSCL